MAGDKATEGVVGITPNVPVVENRMSMRGEGVGRDGKSRPNIGVNIGTGSLGDGRFGFTGVTLPEDAGESILIFPIDIFLKKPHLPFSLLSLPSLDLTVL